MSAKYTVVLRDLLNDAGARPLIDKAMSKYPLYSKTSKEECCPSYIPTRDELNKSILDFYKWREIAFDTPGRFIDELEMSLNEIMPYYNQLFFSADQDFNIIFNVDYVKTLDRDRDSTSTSESEATSSDSRTASGSSTGTTEGDSKHVKATTPGDAIKTPASNIEAVNYADEVNWDKTGGMSTTDNESTESGQSTSNGSSSGTGKEKEKITETTKGNFGVVSAQDLVLKYRETILNIKQMLINDERIAELFMQVY